MKIVGNNAERNESNNRFLLLPLTSLKGISATLCKFLTKLVRRNKIFDLLLHKPIRVEKISICPRLFEVQNGELIIIKTKVKSHTTPKTSRQPYKILCTNPSGYITLVFFKIFPSQIAKMPVDSEIAVLGYLQRTNGENQIIHPHEVVPVSEIKKLPVLNVIYPLNAAITQRFLIKKIHDILIKINDSNHEWIDSSFLKQQGWPKFSNSLKALHYFHSGVEKHKIARQRLAYDELLAWQIATLLAKNKLEKNKSFTKPKQDLTKDFLTSLPFKLTSAQLAAISEIEKEIFSTKKMLRLLQGDVGSGKTIIAIIASLQTISQKKQACIIAPTTVLAKQHLQYFQKLLEKFEIQLAILTSTATKKQRTEVLQKLSQGKIDILIGTHAILEEDIKFQNLGLAIIDEQHRFGVIQRLKLIGKGINIDTLLMSATPIPRSLMMALYGDMDISILNEKPKNRQKVETLIISSQKTNETYEAIKRAILKGEKIYWICPIIEEESNLELTSVKKKFDELKKIFGEENIGLLHGKMKEKEKEEIISNFTKDLNIIVTTTVIEVGIDISDATIIIIENAENFGLSQLHQLRGRVGRSDKKSFCILLYGEKIGQNGRKRLNILRQSDDGFFIAEEDLKMRGSGELLGTKQSGFPEFKIADLNLDSNLLKIACKNAKLILHKDPSLQNKQYQELLQLFSYDDCLKLTASG